MNQVSSVTPIEYLGSTLGVDLQEKKYILAVTVRLNPENFIPTNLILSMEQVRRIYADLGQAIQHMEVENGI